MLNELLFSLLFIFIATLHHGHKLTTIGLFRALSFTDRSYLAIDWHQRAKGRFYDEKASEELEVDDSVNQRTNTGGMGGPGGNKQTIQLTECLDLFTTTEKLGEQDPWLDMYRSSKAGEDTW